MNEEDDALVPNHIPSGSHLARVYAAIQKIAPISMADSSWDNVGLLLQAAGKSEASSDVYVCEDLTRAVCDEVCQANEIRPVTAIVTYHPIIFRALKSMTFADSQQETMSRLLRNGISVYSTHTSLDSCSNGINDHLANVVSGRKDHKFPPITSLKRSYKGHPNAGLGRLVEIEETPLRTIIDRVKENLIDSKKIIVGMPSQSGRIFASNVSALEALIDRTSVSSVAVAAGSGGSILLQCQQQPDVYLTGEMSHHEVLAATEKGIIVLLTLHDNSERSYLSDVFAPRLSSELETDGGGSKINVIVAKNQKPALTVI